MGTTLTGTTPQDTYDSLIKVTDNGPISGTAKFLSDGLGNDSVLALSTARVGVNTNTPQAILHTQNLTAGINTHLQLSHENNYASGAKMSWFAGNNTLEVNRIENELTTDATTSGILKFFSYSSAGGLTEKMRITGLGNVGIGITPQSWLSSRKALDINNGGALAGVNAGWMETWGNSYLDAAGATRYLQTGAAALYAVGNVASGGHIFWAAPSGTAGAVVTLTERARIDNDGLKFNGDTAAANALDDYEEGTWTMGVEFGGASVGVTYANNTGTYTKIGRQVTVNGYLSLTNKGSSTGSARITGLPFTIANGNGFYSTAAVQLVAVTFTNQYSAIAAINTTTIELYENTLLGAITNLTDADFANTSNSVVSLTYFV
jgi:hypothetical protein